MKKLIKELSAFLLLKIYNLHRSNENDILSIYFHNPRPEVFSRVIKWINSKGFKIITPNELRLMISENIKKNKLAIITFDDGWLNNIKLIEIIEKYQSPVTIFITTDAVTSGNFWFEYAKIDSQHKHTNIKNIKEFKTLQDQKRCDAVLILKDIYSLKRTCMTINDIKRLHSHPLVTIGAHTKTHPLLDLCSYQKQYSELLESKSDLECWLQTEIKYLAYPNGDYNQATINLSKLCGYSLGFTNIPGKINITDINPYLIPRNGIGDEDGYYESIAKAIGIWQKYFPKRIHIQKIRQNENITNPR